MSLCPSFLANLPLAVVTAKIAFRVAITGDTFRQYIAASAQGRYAEMTVYTVAQLTITDRTAYNRYREGFMATLTPFGGRLLAADENPRLIEGSWQGDKVVIIAFESVAQVDAWFASHDYVKIAVDRKAGSHGPVLIVEGI